MMVKTPLTDDALGEAAGGAYQPGTDNADVHVGDDEADQIFGAAGADTLIGPGSSDYLQGDGGDDVLDGGSGDGIADVSVGGTGNDAYLRGPGGGSDTFHGAEESDSLVMCGVNLDMLNAGLQVEGSWAKIVPAADGGFQFVNAWTETPAQDVSGGITIGGATLTFTGLDRIYLSA